MRTFYEKIEGPYKVDSDLEMYGMFAGTVTVTSGATLQLHGMVTGDLIVEPNAKVVLHGMVIGGLMNQGGKVEVFGMVNSINDSADSKTILMPGSVVKDS